MPARLYLARGLLGRIDCVVESNPPHTVIVWSKDWRFGDLKPEPQTVRYDTIHYFKVRLKADISPKNLRSGKLKTKNENGYAQEYRYAVRGDRGLSPEEEEEEEDSYGGKDLWKRT